jgi:hypothetical protein
VTVQRTIEPVNTYISVIDETFTSDYGGIDHSAFRMLYCLGKDDSQL